ncbi:MAG TPA: hypothetical protein VGS62_10475 [Streptosporangiaceae bacterium]|nr:hypothetical protein [Streptosporangiaceae bacterium]
MLYMFGFERYGVVISDLYFVDPNPRHGQRGPERGVRLELRVLERGALRGSIYSAQPIAVEQPIWRVDLLESVDGPVGSFDRAHHHPTLRNWEPGRRVFVDELSADPLGWLGSQLSDLDAVLNRAGAPQHEADAADAVALRERAPEILAAVTRLLDGIKAGALATPPGGESPKSARVGWL